MIPRQHHLRSEKPGALSQAQAKIAKQLDALQRDIWDLREVFADSFASHPEVLAAGLLVLCRTTSETLEALLALVDERDDRMGEAHADWVQSLRRERTH